MSVNNDHLFGREAWWVNNLMHIGLVKILDYAHVQKLKQHIKIDISICAA